MNMKNLEFLKDQLKYTGFGEGFDAELRGKIDKGMAEFQISHRAEFNKDVVTATLNYTKSTSSDMYFLNNYKVDLKPENADELMSQTFRIGKENNITLKEAYNLMNGRAVYKEWTKVEKQSEGENVRYVATDEKYHAWKQMNFKEANRNGNFKLVPFTDNYGYNLEEHLEKLPLKDQQNEVNKTRLLESLQKGNRQSVIFIKDGTEQQVFLAANPQFKRIDVYDSNLNKVAMDQHQDKSLKENKDKTKSTSKSKKAGKAVA